MPRRILTKETIDQLLAEGESEFIVAPNDIVTDLAREYAQERGLRLGSSSESASRTQSATRSEAVVDPAACVPVPSPDHQQIQGATTDMAAIHKLVVSALGYEPDGIDLDAFVKKAVK